MKSVLGIIAADLGDQSTDCSKEITFADTAEYTRGGKTIMIVVKNAGAHSAGKFAFRVAFRTAVTF